jgi:ADP-ribose pyrophosphatase YjhB (NUDIX family)/ubiquinone/menaquinone biosynthesis C-methylase UbiE
MQNTTGPTIASYDTVAKNFADRWFDLRLEEQMSRFAGRLGPGARVLDVGCGPGRDAAWLAELGYDAGGVDLSFGMLQEGRARGVDVPLIQADMRHLPFRKGSFDGLWVCASLLHIPKEQVGEVLRELSRVVYPGHMYVAVKRGEGRPSDAHSDGTAEWVEDDEGRRFFFAYYHPAEIQLLLERNGFQVLDCRETPDLSGRSQPWINVLAWSEMRTPHSGANAIVLNEAGEVLLIRRADNGRWCLPGGHVDYGETIAQCVVREAYEETGVHVEVERLSGVYSKPYEAREGLTRPSHYVILAFVCRPVGGEMRLSQESTDVRYFSPDRLPEGLWSWHRERIADALQGQMAPFIR